MTEVHGRFRAAVEAGDLDAIVACFADDICFYSPVKFTPFEGKATVAALFNVLLRTFENFHYVGELDGPVEHGVGGPATPSRILVFRTEVSGRSVHGIDLLQTDGEGLIDAFTVMLRPLSAVQVVGEAIWAGLVADGIVPGR